MTSIKILFFCSKQDCSFYFEKPFPFTCITPNVVIFYTSRGKVFYAKLILLYIYFIISFWFLEGREKKNLLYSKYIFFWKQTQSFRIWKGFQFFSFSNKIIDCCIKRRNNKGSFSEINQYFFFPEKFI